jgi:predicted PurR-regulated permease PerM
MKWYGDDHDSAMIKASIIGLLTAIPVGIPAIVWVPSGLLGLLHNARQKLSLPTRG